MTEVTEGFRIGVISGKLGDVDGVSLEVDKWIRILREAGHTVFTVAGRYANPVAVPAENQFTLEEIRFDSPEQRRYERLAFPHLTANPLPLNGGTREKLVEEISLKGKNVANRLYRLLQDHSIDVLVAQNTNAMPMTLLGGLAIYDLVTERRMATIFHHHDFWWERSRFSHNSIESLLTRIMPPVDLGVEHVVLSTYAAHILRSLKRVHPQVIPNCEDFDNPPVPDEYNSNFRADLGFREDDLLIVQPTRIVRRKRIEDSLALMGRLMRACPELRDRLHYLVSLYQGDENDEHYVEEIREEARRLEVPLHLIHSRVASVRQTDAQGRRMYTNRDVLVNADLVTYLPVWEGFGNALLEAIAARKPLVTTTYLVYKTDIKVTGLENVEIRDRYDREGRLEIPDRTVEEVRHLLTHPEEARRISEKNFAVARREFGLATLRARLAAVLAEYADEIRASRKRLEKSKRSYAV